MSKIVCPHCKAKDSIYVEEVNFFTPISMNIIDDLLTLKVDEMDIATRDRVVKCNSCYNSIDAYIDWVY